MRTNPEWVGDHDNQRIPLRVRLRIFERGQGRCAKCTRILVPGKWAADHIVALANGGQHRETNMQALCDFPCHSDKTKSDVHQKSIDYGRRLNNAGIHARKRTIPGRKFNGTPIPARWKD